MGESIPQGSIAKGPSFTTNVIWIRGFNTCKPKINNFNDSGFVQQHVLVKHTSLFDTNQPTLVHLFI
ncbi:hypothetical protein HanRHA438_Chr01g0007401 [Helianthus annuus]|nr:hypothetical protein HanRHA438_Chr01g0007401 [Helianthus annuus]